MSEEMAYQVEEFLEGLSAAAMGNSISGLAGLVGYVLGAIALYTLAQRRGIQHAWLAWIPVGNVWILGSLADQYKYVARREVKNKRKTLLTLSIIQAAAGLILFAVTVGTIVNAVLGSSSGRYGEEEIFASLMIPVLILIFLSLPLAGVAIAKTVIRFMALYNVFESCIPENATMFLVLSIFFRITEPFFLFFNRMKDTGMVRTQPQNFGQTPSYVNTPENGGTWTEANPAPETGTYTAANPAPETRTFTAANPAPETGADAVAQNPAPRVTVQNPEGSPEPWNQPPKDPWDQGPEQL